MDFELAPEQIQLRNSARKFIAKEIAPIVDKTDRKGPLSRAEALSFLRQLSPFGYVCGTLPETYGGMGIDNLSYGILLEELKSVYASLGGVCSIATAFARNILELGTEEQRLNYLPRLVNLDAVGCMGITEPNAGSDVKSIRATAVLKGSKLRLNGTKTWITNGSIADLCIVLARVEENGKDLGPTRILVDKAQSPFKARNIEKMGLKSCPLAELSFEDVVVPAENILGKPGTGFKSVFKGLDIARANAAIGSVGVAQGAINLAVSYAKERKQFGKPIASFQLVQEMVADMTTSTSAARWMAYHALKLIDENKPSALQASMAKAFATETAVDVTSKALQIHGAYGIAEDYKVERYFRDARCYTIPDGTTQIQKLIIGREILGIKAFN